MLFRRRTPLKWWQHARRAMWPQSGWRRALKYVWHRLARLKDSAHGIAAGVASGVAISCTPFMGFHLIGAMGIAMATRGNVIAALLGTLAGNPWSFPFIWLFIHRLGSWILQFESGAETPRLTLDLVIHSPAAAIGPLLLPMSVGGVLLGVAAWFATYWPIRRAIERFQQMRRRKLAAGRGKARPGRAAKEA